MRQSTVFIIEDKWHYYSDHSVILRGISTHFFTMVKSKELRFRRDKQPYRFKPTLPVLISYIWSLAAVLGGRRASRN